MLFLRSIFCIFVMLFFIHSEFSYADTTADPTANASGNKGKVGDEFIAPMCRVVEKISGPWGKALLVIGAIFVGVNVFIGKFSFTMLIGFIAAGALILSPASIIGTLSGSSFNCKNFSKTGP